MSGCDFDDVDGYGVVEWNDGAFEINNKNVSSTFHDNHWGYELEVIGNIHRGWVLYCKDDLKPAGEERCRLCRKRRT